MPLRFFNCPDKVTRPITECLEHCPRPEGRCLSLPSLTSIGQSREWRGKPSTTQLLNPTRLEYLKIVKPYAIDPFDRAFALLGTRHHGRLEAVAHHIEGLEAEVKLDGEVSGILDLLEPIDGDDEYRLIDYKSYGSFAVAKHLGTSKTDGELDRYHLALQMNNYRLMAEKLGFNVVELKCQITVRDGGTWTARNNGVNDKLLMIPIEILPDQDVWAYFQNKSECLLTALETETLPELCPYNERWQNKRCKGYCEIFRWCPEGAKMNKVRFQE